MLTYIAGKTAKCPDDKPPARLTDAGSLYLEVSACGSKRWFWKFQRDGKERRMALGSYPTVSLKQARSARDEARKVHATGKDPVTDRLNEPSLRRPLKRWRATSTPPKDYQGVDKRAALT